MCTCFGDPRARVLHSTPTAAASRLHVRCTPQVHATHWYSSLAATRSAMACTAAHSRAPRTGLHRNETTPPPGAWPTALPASSAPPLPAAPLGFAAAVSAVVPVPVAAGVPAAVTAAATAAGVAAVAAAGGGEGTDGAWGAPACKLAGDVLAEGNGRVHTRVQCRCGRVGGVAVGGADVGVGWECREACDRTHRAEAAVRIGQVAGSGTCNRGTPRSSPPV